MAVATLNLSSVVLLQGVIVQCYTQPRAMWVQKPIKPFTQIVTVSLLGTSIRLAQGIKHIDPYINIDEPQFKAQWAFL